MDDWYKTPLMPQIVSKLFMVPVTQTVLIDLERCCLNDFHTHGTNEKKIIDFHNLVHL